MDQQVVVPEPTTGGVPGEVGGEQSPPASPPTTGAEGTVEELTPEQQQQQDEDRKRRREARDNRANAEARVEARMLREENQRLRAERAYLPQTQPQPQQPQFDANRMPAREQFSNFEDYSNAVTRWHANQAAGEYLFNTLRTIATAQQQEQMQRETQRVVNDHESRIERFARSVEDWDETVIEREDVIVPPLASAILMQMEDGPAAMYAIGKNPAIVRELRNMNAVQATVYLAKVANAVKGTSQSSNAPAPGSPVRNTASKGGADNPPTNPDAYMAWAAKHMK
jgi:hypothetical protein